MLETAALAFDHTVVGHPWFIGQVVLQLYGQLLREHFLKMITDEKDRYAGLRHVIKLLLTVAVAGEMMGAPEERRHWPKFSDKKFLQLSQPSGDCGFDDRPAHEARPK